MSSVSQYAQTLGEILQERANVLARETGFIQRERSFDGADFAVSLIFAWLQEPHISLDGLVQVLCRREVSISASGLTQRFSPESAVFFQRLLEKLTQADLQAEAEVQSALLRRFGAVLLEDASSISLPNELATV